MTGNWGGLRDDLKDAGVSFDLFFVQFYQKAVHGGRELNGSGRSSGSMDLILDFDLSKLKLIEGGLFHVHVRRQWGAGINLITGALQQVNDDADGDQTTYIDNMWYEQATLNGKWAFRIGYLDGQTYFERNAYANSEDKQFWNAALDNNPIVSFTARSGLGIAAFHRPIKWFTLIISVTDADTFLYKPGFSTTFHDQSRFFGIVEGTFHAGIPTERGPLKGNYSVGMAYDPRVRPVYSVSFGTPRQHSRGNDYAVYTNFDQMLYREDAETDQGLGWFFRYGYRRPDIARSNLFWSMGFQYQGLIPTRDKDVLGLAVARQLESPRYHRYVNRKADAETIYELYYSVVLTPWLVVGPDIQYVTNPGGDSRNDDLVTLGLRTRVSF